MSLKCSFFRGLYSKLANHKNLLWAEIGEATTQARSIFFIIFTSFKKIWLVIFKIQKPSKVISCGVFLLYISIQVIDFQIIFLTMDSIGDISRDESTVEGELTWQGKLYIHYVWKEDWNTAWNWSQWGVLPLISIRLAFQMISKSKDTFLLNRLGTC